MTTAGIARPAVLIVEDDRDMCDSWRYLLRLQGFMVGVAHSGSDAIRIGASGVFDLALLDLMLGDMLATDVMRALRAQDVAFPFAVITGHFFHDGVEEAVQLGAVEVMFKPVFFDSDLVSKCRRWCRSTSVLATENHATRDIPHGGLSMIDEEYEPGSNVERLARLIWKGGSSKSDLTTIPAWGEFTGVSASVLRKLCDMLGIAPHDAHRLMRVLRAALQSQARGCSMEDLLLVSDETLVILLRAANLPRRARFPTIPSVAAFLNHQRFVDPSHEVIRALLKQLAVR